MKSGIRPSDHVQIAAALFYRLNSKTGHDFFLKLGRNIKDNMGNKLVYFVSLGKISVPPKSEKNFKIESKSWIFK